MANTYDSGSMPFPSQQESPDHYPAEQQPPRPASEPAFAAPPSSTAPPPAYTPQPSTIPSRQEQAGGPPAQRPREPAPRPWWRGPLGIVVALAILALLFVGGWAIANPSASGGTGASSTVAVPAAAQDMQQTIINTIQTVQPSVVQVTSRGAKGGAVGAIGSGEILTSDGYIVTNDHVVAGFTSYTATLANGQTLAAELVGTAPQDDLAVLKVAATNLRPIQIANSSAVQVGQFAVALGSPLGLEQSATQGIVSALDRQASEGLSGPTLTGLIQRPADQAWTGGEHGAGLPRHPGRDGDARGSSRV